MRLIDLATVLCFYDHILTFFQEVQYIWKRRFSGITAIFLLNRYVVMSDRIVRLFQFKSWRGYGHVEANDVRTPAPTRFLVYWRFSCKMLCLGFSHPSSDRSCNIGWRWSEASTVMMHLCIVGAWCISTPQSLTYRVLQCSRRSKPTLSTAKTSESSPSSRSWEPSILSST